MNLIAQATLPPSTSYRIIALTQGQYTIVDAEDYERLIKFSWHAEWNSHTQSYYAKRSQNHGKNADGKTIIKTYRIQNEIMGKAPDGMLVDHVVRGETLDNRKSNLRFATPAQNNQNRKLQKNNTSGYKGVSWHKYVGMWSVNIMYKNKLRNLGYFPKDQIVQAHECYCKAATELFGEFACFQ